MKCHCKKTTLFFWLALCFLVLGILPILLTWPAHTRVPYNFVTFSPDGKQIACGSKRNVRFWATDSWKASREISGLPGPILCMAFTSDWRSIAIGMEINGKPPRGEMGIYDLDSGNMHRVFVGRPIAVENLAVSSCGRWVCSAGKDGFVLWDLRKGVEPVFRSPGGPLVAMDNTRLIVANGPWKNDKKGTTVKMWNMQTHKNVCEMTLEEALKRDGCGLTCMSINGANDLIAVGGWQFASIWRVGDNKNLWTFRCHVGCLCGIAFTADGKKVATCGSHPPGVLPGEVKVWDVERKELIFGFAFEQGPVLSVDFAPNGKLVAAGLSDNSVKVWEVATGKEVASLR